MVCPVDQLPSLASASRSDLETLVQELASRDPDHRIEPASFHQEDRDRFQNLGQCSEGKIEVFARFQTDLSGKIAQLSTAQIRKVLEGLYYRAYTFDPSSGEMGLTTTPGGQQAKRQLDLWAAAIEHRVFEDESFLEALRTEGKIRAVLVLNSPQMSAQDRGAFERLIRADKQGPSKFHATLPQLNAEAYERQFAWLQSYDGKGRYFEAPFWRSNIEFYTAGISYFGKERFLEMATQGFPRKTVKQLILKNNLMLRYAELQRQSTAHLTDYYRDLLVGAVATNRPGFAKTIMKDMMMVWILFHERGVDPEKALMDKAFGEMVQRGWSPEDARQFFDLQQGTIKYTADRIDDYRGRFALLRQYRRLYENILTEPLDETFSQEQQKRYAIWGSFILNRSQSGIPIDLAELDQVRREVQQQVVPYKDFSPGRSAFEFRDREQALWFAPSDLGLCGVSLGGPLMLLSQVSAYGVTANELICDNIELLAFLPPHLMPTHLAASAFGLFGMATVRNSGMEAGNDWTPGLLLSTLTHEASHIEWFRENFDDNSQRLALLGPNERRAYAVDHAYAKAYALSPVYNEPSEQQFFERLAFGRSMVETANETLEIPSGQMDPFYWRSDWDGQPLKNLVFQPPALVAARRRHEITTAAFGTISDEEIYRAGIPLFHNAINMMFSSPGENWEARGGLLHLISVGNRERGLIISDFSMDLFGGISYRAHVDELPVKLFLKSHPITRVYNELRAAVGEPPVFIIDADQETWLKQMDDVTRAFIEMERLGDLARRHQASQSLE